jgi:hypothetical protein
MVIVSLKCQIIIIIIITILSYTLLCIWAMCNHYKPMCIYASYDVHFINVCAFPIRCTKLNLAISYYTLVVLLIQYQCGVHALCCANYTQSAFITWNNVFNLDRLNGYSAWSNQRWRAYKWFNDYANQIEGNKLPLSMLIQSIEADKDKALLDFGFESPIWAWRVFTKINRYTQCWCLECNDTQLAITLQI